MSKIIILILSIFIYSVSSANEFLMKPKGKYEVGFKDFHWVHGDKNSDRNYICSEENQDPFYKYGQSKNNYSQNNQVNFCREIMVRIYFPITNHGSKLFETIYNPSSSSLVSEIQSLKITNVTSNDYNQIKFLNTWTYNFNNIDNLSPFILKQNSKKFPVLFFSPGNGEVVQDYENFITELTSQGYIVVGVNNPFVSGPILMPNAGMKKLNTNNRTVIRNDEIINKAHAENEDLTSSVPVNDILLALEKTFQKIQIAKEGSLFTFMDSENFAVLGHSGGANASVAVSQNEEAVSRFHIKAVASLDSGYGVFASANCINIATGQVFTNPPPPTVFYGNLDTVGTNIPFMHFHSSAQGYGCTLGINAYLEKESLQPNNLMVHNKNEYWVYMAPQNVLDSIPTTALPIPITISSDAFYTAHHNFNDYGTLQNLPLFQKTIQYFKLKNPSDLQTLLAIGTADGENITNQVNLYLKEFFDLYLKNNDSKYLNSCSAISNDSLLECKK
jgi:hypothetical protein